MARALPKPTPGDILHYEFMLPLALTPRALAEALEVPEATIADVVAGVAPITDNLAQQLSAHFGTTAELWLNLQFSHDVIKASIDLIQDRVAS